MSSWSKSSAKADGDGCQTKPISVWISTPATFKVLELEHHVAVYAGKNNQTIVKAERPPDLLRNSVVTPSLEVAIMNSKYVNAIPLYRLEQEFARNAVHLPGRTYPRGHAVANWTILCVECYLSLLWDRMHREMCICPVIQADETPVLVNKDGRKAGSKSYMWFYRTGKLYDSPLIVLYEYQKTRNTSHPWEFLKGYRGTCVTDGYQVYHILENECKDLEIARRCFADVVKSLGKEKAKDTLAYQALEQIGAIFKLESAFGGLSPEERVIRRQSSIRPRVEACFEWIRANQNKVPPKSETGKGFAFCLNQEKYLKVFLSNGRVPADNNAAEQAIRGFCIGKCNWHLIDTIHGAQASTIIYSIAETAKANNLKPYYYFEHMLTEIPKHLDDIGKDFLESLLPWSSELPAECRKINQ